MRNMLLIVWTLLGVFMVHSGYAQENQGGHSAPQQATAADTGEESSPTARFDVWEYRVSGNTLLKREQIERTVYPFLGRDKTIRDIQKARVALEKRYHDAGYATVLVDIPQQEVTDGIVHLNVTEGAVDRLLVTGSNYFSLQRIRGEVPSLAPGSIPYLPDVQQQLMALNRQTGDRSVTPVLRPGRTPGTVEVELKVKDQLPLHGSAEVDNHNSADTTRLRVNGMLRYDNLWQKEHSLSVQYQTSPENTDEVRVWSATYLARGAHTNNLLAVYGVHSESNTATVGTLAVVGRGDIVGLRGIIPLKSSKDYFHSLTLGVDYKDFKETVVPLGADQVNYPIQYVPFSVLYNGTQRGDSGTTQFGVSINFGIRGLVNDAQKFDEKRYKSQANYIYLRANLERNQALYRGSRMRVALNTQITNSPLISNEQFSAGGADSVRGYHESEVLGDDAIQGTVEFISPSLARGALAKHIQDWRALLFWDGADLRIRDALPGQATGYVISSAGVGMRLKAWRHLNATLSWAQVFHGTSAVSDGDRRLDFSVEYAF